MQKKEQMSQKFACVKNLIIGFLIGLCLMLAIAAASSNDTTSRYQCCSSGDDNFSVFIIDTVTGQTWRLGRTDYYDYGTPKVPKSVRRSIAPLVN